MSEVEYIFGVPAYERGSRPVAAEVSKVVPNGLMHHILTTLLRARHKPLRAPASADHECRNTTCQHSHEKTSMGATRASH